MNKLEMLSSLKKAVKLYGLTYSLSGSSAINIPVVDVVLNIEAHKDNYGWYLKVTPNGDTFDMFSSDTEFDDVAMLSKKINILKKQLHRLNQI